MKIALVGYGKMGRLLEQLAPEYGWEVALRLTAASNAGGQGITREAFSGIPVAIEFSEPGAAVDNIERLSAIGVHTVVGTTGWFAELPRVEAIVAGAQVGLVYSPNFSIGVNVFFRAVAETARLLQNEPEYEAHAWEIHHRAKKDAPSGTMRQLIEEMQQAGYEREIDVASNRAGHHPGTHEIGFDSAADTITLRHTARSREGFARGALKAASWIRERKGCFPFRTVLFG